MAHTGTVVVEAVVVMSNPVVVLVDVAQATELVCPTRPVTVLQVTYKSYPVNVLIQEFVDVSVVEVGKVVVSVGESVGSSDG